MKTKTFFIGLLITTGVVIGINHGISTALRIEHHEVLSYISIGFFLLLCATMYFLGDKAARSSNKFTFIRIAMVNMMVKMFASVLIVAVYTKTVEIDTKLFILPFFVAYLLYTAYETYVLYKISKIRYL